MICFFCGSPSAHPSTGTQYTPRALACRDCSVAFNRWLVSHTRGKSKRASARLPTAESFYEAAAKVAPSLRVFLDKPPSM